MSDRALVALQPRRPSDAAVTLVAGDGANSLYCANEGDTPLGRLHRRLVDGASAAAEMSDATGGLAALFGMALKHVEALRERGFDAMPWHVGLFGRAHLTRRKVVYVHPNRCGSVKVLDLDSGRREMLPRPDMRYGGAIESDVDVTTESGHALLLFADGTLVHVPPYHTGAVRELARPWVRPRPLDSAS